MDRKHSIEKQIEQLEENLRLIEERKSMYVEETSIPLQLIKEERRLVRQRDDLSDHLQQLQAFVPEPALIRPVPRLLPYMPNRDDQEFSLGEALERLRQQPSQILVCLVHGDEFQCHDMFLERLKQVSLPRILALDPERTTVASYPLEWPARLQHIDSLHHRLRKKLAENVLDQSRVSVEEVNRVLVTLPGPVIIHTHLLTEDCQRHGLAALVGFLQFWRDWPSPPPGKFLLVFLCIKYQVKENLGPVKRHRFRVMNNKIAKWLQELSLTDFDRLECVMLPKLEGVTRTEAECWARHKDTVRFCPFEELHIGIRKIYEKWELDRAASTIPMEVLAHKLRDILCRYVSAKEKSV